MLLHTQHGKSHWWKITDAPSLLVIQKYFNIPKLENHDLQPRIFRTKQSHQEAQELTIYQSWSFCDTYVQYIYRWTWLIIKYPKHACFTWIPKEVFYLNCRTKHTLSCIMHYAFQKNSQCKPQFQLQKCPVLIKELQLLHKWLNWTLAEHPCS